MGLYLCSIPCFQNEIDTREPTFENLVNEGPKWVQDESDLQQQSLKEQLDSIESGWKDLHELSDARQKQLLQSLNYQVCVECNGVFAHTNFSSIFSCFCSGVSHGLSFFSCSREMQSKQIPYWENRSYSCQRMRTQ